MKLTDAMLMKMYKIKKIKISDPKLNLRIRELGFFEGGEIKLLKFSPLKKTVLVEIFNTVFAIKKEIANQIFVE